MKKLQPHFMRKESINFYSEMYFYIIEYIPQSIQLQLLVLLELLDPEDLNIKQLWAIIEDHFVVQQERNEQVITHMVRRLPKEFRPLVLDFLAKNFGRRGIDALSIERAVTNTVNDLKKLQNDSVMGYFKEDAANKIITIILAINTAIAKVTG